MKITTHLRKMKTSLDPLGSGKALYQLPLFNILEYEGLLDMNQFVGKEIGIHFENEIHCIETGKKIKKTFGEGLSYESFLKSPMAVESIIRPELSRIHEGIALRDKEWEEAHHNQPHFVYLSNTGDIKVGVTRTTNVPSRWIDQGASQAIILAETPYRQLAGLIEVALKDFFPDKTHWQNMLKNVFKTNDSLVDRKNHALEVLPPAYEPFFFDDDSVTVIDYPVVDYPLKIKSIKLDNGSDIQSRLVGIKGQYLLFDGGEVLNIRSHSAYKVTFTLPG